MTHFSSLWQKICQLLPNHLPTFPVLELFESQLQNNIYLSLSNSLLLTEMQT